MSQVTGFDANVARVLCARQKRENFAVVIGNLRLSLNESR
jgi:hypothetical protein